MSQDCYLNGEIIPLKDAKIRIDDLAVLRGFGIYEGITAFAGEPFHFEDHWKRFENSARPLGLVIPSAPDIILESMKKLIARNSPNCRASIRMVLTGGVALGGLEHVPGRESLFITVEPTVPLPESSYTKGASLITQEHERYLPEYKTIHYIEAVVLQPKRKAAGAVEILYTTKGAILECATSNVFIVKDGKVITPKEGVLPGITRQVVLDLARDAFPVEERAVTTAEMLGADEVFITSSFKDIVPIVKVDERMIANGAPGPVTLELMDRFKKQAQAH